MEIPIITREKLKHLIDIKDNYVLIDVRNNDELAHGMIPTAGHIPLSELGQSLILSVGSIAS